MLAFVAAIGTRGPDNVNTATHWLCPVYRVCVALTHGGDPVRTRLFLLRPRPEGETDVPYGEAALG